jgi:hypothetical protein
MALNVDDVQAMAKIQYGGNNVWFVSSTGNDSNSGKANDSANAFLTLDKAISSATYKDTIVIMDQAYVSSDLFVETTLVGYNEALTTVVYVNAEATLTLSDCKIRNICFGLNSLVPSQSNDGKAIIFDGQIDIENCGFNGSEYNNISADEGLLFIGSKLDISDCTFTVSLANLKQEAFYFSSVTSGVNISNCEFSCNVGVLDASVGNSYFFHFDTPYFVFSNNILNMSFCSFQTHNIKKNIMYVENAQNCMIKDNTIVNIMYYDYNSTSVNNEMVGIRVNNCNSFGFCGNSIYQQILYPSNINYDIKIEDSSIIYADGNIYNPTKISGNIQKSLPSTEKYNIDSTGGNVALSKAIEIILAAIMGNSTTDVSGKTSFKGRDGATEVATATTVGDGVRTSSTIS